jgi:uncharacterized repeat protein (TIGR01451 family)
MLPKILPTITNILLGLVCLAMIGFYLFQAPLSLPETAGQQKPSQPALIKPGELDLMGPAALPTAADVIPFVKTLYIHGVPYDLARQFGPDAVPLLLDLLADPENELFATNIVVTLGFIGQPSARQPLLDYLTQTQGEVSLNQFRGLTSVPYALSQLAHQGDVASLTFLLEAAESNYWTNHPLSWSYNGQSPTPELDQQTLLGLGVSGLPQALTRLQELAGRMPLAAQADNEVLQQALALNEQVHQEGMAPVVNPDPNTLVPPENLRSALESQANDTNSNSHLQTFTIARHVNMSSPPSNAQVDLFLAEASQIMQTADSPTDISCCISLQRSGSIATFAQTNGTITTNSELNAAFAVTSFNVKMVPTLDYCGGFNTSIIGCAFIGSPKNMVLEYLGNTTFDAILWAHEFGHNQGLQHPNPSVQSRIMNGFLTSAAQQMTQSECTAWHSTPDNPGSVLGPCPFNFTVNKTLEATSVVTSGATISYIITIVNNTPSDITGMTMSDSLPAQLSYVNDSATASPPIVNLTNFPTSSGSFTMVANSSLQITYQATVGVVADKETFVNTATVNISGQSQPRQATHTAIVNPIISYLPLIFK